MYLKNERDKKQFLKTPSCNLNVICLDLFEGFLSQKNIFPELKKAKNKKFIFINVNEPDVQRSEFDILTNYFFSRFLYFVLFVSFQ